MKKILLVPLAWLFFLSANAQNFGSFATGIFITKNGTSMAYGVTGSNANQIGPNSFTGSLGTFGQNSGSLLLNGGETKTYKNDGANVCGSTVYYSVHPVGATGGYSSLNIGYKAGCSGNQFSDGLGPCGGNDQKWSDASQSIDLTAYCPGTYAIDVYYVIPGSNSNSSACNETQTVGSPASPAGSATFTITGTTPTASGSTTVCPGATAPITASGCEGGVTTWSNGATGTTINAPAGSYTATCTINGCVSPASNPVTITETPVAPPTISGPSTVCVGASTTLTASGCSGDVTWSNGATGSSISAPAGSYTATCTVNGCTSPASATAEVTETPVTPPTISGPSTVCVGASTTLTASGCSGDVTWSNGATGESISAPAGSYTATCTVNGCTSPASAPAEVIETPVAPPTISGSATVCVGSSTTLTVSGSSGDVTWSNGITGESIAAPAGSYTATRTVNGCTSPPSAPADVTETPVAPPSISGCSGDVTWSNGATGESISAPAGSYTASCNVNGCTSPASAPADVTETPVAPPTISGPSTVCVGASTTLTASGCSGDVTWSNGATGSSISAPAGSYTATCTVNGCTSPASAPADVTETPVAPPVISGGGAVCAGSAQTLTASGCTGGTVTWSNGATGATINAPAGTYTATCNINGCISTSSDPANGGGTVTEKPTPSSPTIVLGPTACPSGNAKVTASGCSGGVVTWSNGATGSEVSLQAGTYTATCTIDGCISAPKQFTVPPYYSPCPTTSNLIVNGSFEAVPITGTSYTIS